MFKKSLFYVALAVCLMPVGGVQAEELTNQAEELANQAEPIIYDSPEHFVQSFIQEVFGFIKASKDSSEEELVDLLIESSRKYFDTRRMARLVLGKNLKKITAILKFETFLGYFERSISRKLIYLLKNTSIDVDNVAIENFKLVKTKESTKNESILYVFAGKVSLPDKPKPIPVKLFVIKQEDIYKMWDIEISNIRFILTSRDSHNYRIRNSEDIESYLEELESSL